MNQEELLAIRIRQLEGRSEDVAEAIHRQREAQLRNKHRFDAKHRLRPRKIEEGDWVIVYNSSLDHQHTTLRKFAKRWFGLYEVRKVFDNGTYRLSELDGTELRVPIAGKGVKIFKKRTDKEPYVGNASDEEQSDKDHDNAVSCHTAPDLRVSRVMTPQVRQLQSLPKHPKFAVGGSPLYVEAFVLAPGSFCPPLPTIDASS
jgi:translation initiation factor IF-1